MTIQGIKKLLLQVILCFPLVSIGALVYYANKSDAHEIFFDEGNYFIYAMSVSALISITLLLTLGSEKILFFIPDDWGKINIDGDFISVRKSVGGYISTGLSVYFIYTIYQLINSKAKIKKLENKIKLQKSPK